MDERKTTAIAAAAAATGLFCVRTAGAAAPGKEKDQVGCIRRPDCVLVVVASVLGADEMKHFTVHDAQIRRAALTLFKVIGRVFQCENQW